MFIKRNNAGFTLLFAVLIGSLLFTLGLAIANIALKEIILSSSGKESEKAFFSADTGTECALYWDIRRGVFPEWDKDDDPTEIQCAGISITEFDIPVKDKKSATTKFMLNAPPFCAEVTVEKTHAPEKSTKIESRGKSDCDFADNPSRVERALRVTY